MFDGLTGQNLATIGGYASSAVLLTLLLIKGANVVQAGRRKVNRLARMLEGRGLKRLAGILEYVGSNDLGGATAQMVSLLQQIDEGEGDAVLDELLKPSWLAGLSLRVQDIECVEAFQAALDAHRQTVATRATRTLAEAKATTV